MENGSFICHAFAFLQVEVDDDVFYFDENKHKWTEASFIKVIIDPDREAPADVLFPLQLMATTWKIDISQTDVPASKTKPCHRDTSAHVAPNTRRFGL